MNKILLILACIALTACQSISGFKAEEVHHTVSFPLIFTDSIHALGIKKTTAADGSVIYKAETLTHETTVGGFTRTATYKGAQIKEKP